MDVFKMNVLFVVFVAVLHIQASETVSGKQEELLLKSGLNHVMFTFWTEAVSVRNRIEPQTMVLQIKNK